MKLPYRTNVGAILRRSDGRLLMCERLQPRDVWQFPQGGVDAGETREEAMWREVSEELGLLDPRDLCELVAVGPETRYHFPPAYDAPIARRFQGQAQTLFLLDFHGTDDAFDLDYHREPEFAAFQWVEKARAIDLMWDFKSRVLHETFDALRIEFDAGWIERS